MGRSGNEMDLNRTNSMIIITGASRGIGKYLLNHYKREGKDVIGLYNATKPEVNRDCYHKVDVTRDDEITSFLNSCPQLNNIVLINAAGISYNAFAHKADMDLWRDVIDTNVVGLFNFTRHLLPIMRNDNYGRVINFSSVVAQHGVMGTSAYAASKSALWGLSKALAIENGSKNITVNTINPGYFNIGMINEVPDDLLNSIIQKIPAKRLGDPAELLSTVNYIIENAYLNGATIDLNGGLF